MSQPNSQEPPLDPLAEYIISRSTGIFGDFQMRVCADLIRTEGVTKGWAYQITDSTVRRILRRYKEHVVFWNTPEQTVLDELAIFNDAITNAARMSYPWDTIVQWYNELPPKRAPPNESV